MILSFSVIISDLGSINTVDLLWKIMMKNVIYYVATHRDKKKQTKTWQSSYLSCMVSVYLCVQSYTNMSLTKNLLVC